MKYILIALLLLFGLMATAQEDTTKYQKYPNAYGPQYRDIWATRVMRLPDTANTPMQGVPGAIGRNTAGTALFIWDGTQWIAAGNGASEIIPGGPFVTENIHIAFDPGTNLTPAQVIQKVWYGTRPLATLTGGTLLEYTSASTVAQTLSWGVTRQVGAPTLSTIVVAGVSQAFVQPAQGSTVSGTQGVNVPANTTTTYSNIVTASDAQTATATTTFNFLGRKYYGIISDTAGIGTGTQDAAILALTNSFATSKSLSTNTGSITGTKFWVYAYPAILGSLTALLFNSIPALEAMNFTTRSFTNSLGYTQSYILYWNKQGQTTSSDITAQ